MDKSNTKLRNTMIGQSLKDKMTFEQLLFQYVYESKSSEVQYISLLLTLAPGTTSFMPKGIHQYQRSQWKLFTN
jgi:hypothetical protein